MHCRKDSSGVASIVAQRPPAHLIIAQSPGVQGFLSSSPGEVMEMEAITHHAVWRMKYRAGDMRLNPMAMPPGVPAVTSYIQHM